MLQGAVPEITEWVYSLQVIPKEGHGEDGTCYGFRGSPSLGVPYCETGVSFLIQGMIVSSL